MLRNPIHPAPERTADVNALVRQQRVMLATVLLLLDALYLVANVVYLGTNSPDEPHSLVSNDLWNGDLDGSFIEIFGHAQLIAAAVGLVFVAVRRRSAVLGVWAAVLVALVADDFLQLHETIGAVLVRALGLPDVLILTSQDVGELLVWATAAVVLGALLLIAYARADAESRGDARRLLGLVAVLAVFAVGLDQVQGLIAERLPLVLQVVATLAETGGELVAMTLIVLFVHAVSLRSGSGQQASVEELESELVPTS